MIVPEVHLPTIKIVLCPKAINEVTKKQVPDQNESEG